ncbi:MAG: manganese efflux pump MntP family protein [Eubacteriales bacterium]|nr:manganese efflux pump MntP family protein [Eubacteriales bacterium]
MGLIEIIFLAFGLSMDAFAVSICKGLSLTKADIKAGIICGLWFGSFQALMPFIGYFLGARYAYAVESVDHWIAFVLLGLIGFNMIKEAFSEEESGKDKGDLSPKNMLVLAVATSIDALVVGISLAMAGNVNIATAVIFIGVITFAMSFIGVKLGRFFGSKLKKNAQILGGVILCFLGVKILMEHLGIF